MSHTKATGPHTSEPGHCVSCGAELRGDYCAACGEQRLTPHLRSLSHIALTMVEELTSLDGKVWRTIRTLALSPGRLEHDYRVGRRVGYMKPVTLFFIVNILYVTFSPLNDFYVSFYDQQTAQIYSNVTTPLITDYIEDRGMSADEFGEFYDQLVGVTARSLIILQVPFFTLLASLILMRRSYFASDYFMYGLNAHTWLLSWSLVALVVGPVVTYPLNLLGAEITRWQIFSLIFPLGFVIYVALASRTMFGLTWMGTALRVPLLLVAFAASHMAYRLVQLIITVALVST